MAKRPPSAVGYCSMTFDKPCPECKSTSPLHMPKCQFDFPPLNLTLEYLLKQEDDFHICRPSRGYACTVCGKHARYCGHTKAQMVDALVHASYPEITPAMSAAMGAWLALTARERQALACWFCPSCQAHIGPGESHSCPLAEPTHDTEPAPPGHRWPTLEAIGLDEALDAVEAVAAANQGKHPGRKWLTKSVPHHDAKAIKHLGTVQCGQPFDSESGLRGRAHVGLRVLMALGLELLRGG